MTARALHDGMNSCRLSDAANLADRSRLARLEEIMPCHEFGRGPEIALADKTYRPEASWAYAMKR